MSRLTFGSSGSIAGFYQWSRGVQIRANLDLLMDWIQSIGLGDLANEYLRKLSAAVNLLAMPRESLLQVRGRPLPVCDFLLGERPVTLCLNVFILVTYAHGLRAHCF